MAEPTRKKQYAWLKTQWEKPWIKACALLGLLFCIFLLAVPAPRFRDPYSMVLRDREGRLLGARVAADGQWRFEQTGPLPEKYVQALLTYEDRYFYDHPGVNPVSILKSAYRDIRAGSIVSGGSTITMQLARLAEKNPPRTFPEKFWEILMAFKAEIVFSKPEILDQYAAHAPFGGNVVGIQAACWRFFGTSPQQLSWAQAATLAVLPNSPALIFPGKNQQLLKRKRNALLKRLQQRQFMDSITCALACQEPVPGPPVSIPQWAPQLAGRLIAAKQGSKKSLTTLDLPLQKQVGAIIARYHRLYKDNQIYNAAALVLDVKTGKVLAYIGNTNDTTATHGSRVDIITAPRSYGSLLKPFLYIASLEGGKICPESLLPDYPADFGGFSPQNYHIDFDGVVPADQVLIRSLNVPSVFLLQRYGTPLFLDWLRKLGLTTFTRPASYYGLSLILGGGESSLWELTGAYAALAHRLLNRKDTAFTTSFLRGEHAASATLSTTYHTRQLHRSAIWTAFNVLSNLYRPGDDGRWQQFSSSEKIAWKTGTSFGNRDAWAVGVTSRYAVGVWIGNASGEGRPELIGATCAAPVLFDIFSLLPDAPWFPRPTEGWTKLAVCTQSGDKASVNCDDTQRETVPAPCSRSPVCSFHRLIHLDATGRYRVSSLCMDPADMRTQSWFVLSPVEQWYYRKRHSDYIPLPPFMQGCTLDDAAAQSMTLIYPSRGENIYIPREREGQRGKTIFEVAHRDAGAVIYWHMDGRYLGSTQGVHKMEIDAPFGLHHFTLVDGKGDMLRFKVTFLQKESRDQKGD